MTSPSSETSGQSTSKADKPPAISQEEILRRILEDVPKIVAEDDKKPKRFKHGEGVELPPPDDKIMEPLED